MPSGRSTWRGIAEETHPLVSITLLLVSLGPVFWLVHAWGGYVCVVRGFPEMMALGVSLSEHVWLALILLTMVSAPAVVVLPMAYSLVKLLFWRGVPTWMAIVWALGVPAFVLAHLFALFGLMGIGIGGGSCP